MFCAYPIYVRFYGTVFDKMFVIFIFDSVEVYAPYFVLHYSFCKIFPLHSSLKRERSRADLLTGCRWLFKSYVRLRNTGV